MSANRVRVTHPLSSRRRPALALLLACVAVVCFAPRPIAAGAITLALGGGDIITHASPGATSVLDPLAFTSLGPSPFVTAGDYVIDASRDNAAPTISGPGIATPIAGIFFSPSGGVVGKDEIAVFVFDAIDIPAGVTVKGAPNANSRPVALLSQSSVTVAGVVDVSGEPGVDGILEGDGGNGGNAGPGGGGGGGGKGQDLFTSGSGGLGFANGEPGTSATPNGGSVVAGGGGRGIHSHASNGGGSGGGGAFGGDGGPGESLEASGGTSYGDLAVALQGGSGGAGGAYPPRVTFGGWSGGGGGGAIELGGLGTMSIPGAVYAIGGVGAGLFAGGGAGGGILVHAPIVSLTGTLNAPGGNTGKGGGAGGGGRVLILTADGTLAAGSLAASVRVNGGTVTNRDASQGQPGVATLAQYDFPDITPPTITASIGGTLGSNGWYVSNVTVGWIVTDESPVSSQSGCTATTITSDTPGTTLTCTATSVGGTSSKSVTINRDATAPTVNLVAPASASYFLGQVVTASYGCSDARSGLASCAGTVANGTSINTATVGAKPFSVTAIDQAGNTARASVTYNVLYNWSGFFQPVDNLPVVNRANAGLAIPVKFSLHGNQGLDILAAGSPASQAVACGGTAIDDVEQTDTSAGSSLQYEAGSDSYKYVWKTEKGWKGSCRQLIVQLKDGSAQIAVFQFK